MTEDHGPPPAPGQGQTRPAPGPALPRAEAEPAAGTANAPANGPANGPAAGAIPDSGLLRHSPWWLRVAVTGIVLLAVAVVWVTNSWLTQRFTESTRNRAEVRVALYTGNIISELQRNSVVPLLLARDPELIAALNSQNYALTSARLISAQEEIGAASILLVDAQGRVVAATDRGQIGKNLATEAFFISAQRSKDTVFTVTSRESGGSQFTYARSVISENKMAGAILVGVDLSKFERSWSVIADAIAVTDSEGRIILSTEPRWRGLTMAEALAVRSAPSAIQRALQATTDWANEPPDAYVRGEGVMRIDARIPFRGWRITSFSTYDSVREQVNAVLALEIMGFAILLALAFYTLSRRVRTQSKALMRESAELRQLNARLQREIAEREKAQKDLAVAEQTLAQSSKLAALGEMSAAVSHELNQPLAAMKTYLAGARLLLQRDRPVEAMSSFQRIDDLIERMGAITRQLKSYARKGGEAFEPVDLRLCLSSALTMMEPQLRTRSVRIIRTLPKNAVMVMADRVRLEQVIINLLRNALDATQEVKDPQIEILLALGETARLTVRDNGHGIKDLEKLFEPFWTTKKPGEGVGLGLAISSGIVADLGGRLTARNAEGGGAVFEMQLPVLGQARAAE